MKRILAVLTFSALMIPLICRAQQDPVVIEVNGEKITQSEFMKDFIYSQGKVAQNPAKISKDERRKALNEYVDLFVNYRAKLADAYAMGFDTVTSLVKELKKYRDELAAPYLIDSATMQHILKEAYERNKYAVHAAHILIAISEEASPEDTLKAYNTAMEYYKRATAGEDFYDLANEAKYAQSPKGLDKVEAKNPFEGDLGCFTVFDMIYPFENIAYSIEPGSVGKPIRTKFGYHVVKVFDRVPFYGKTKLSHIWTRDDANPARAKARINMAWEGLQAGNSWDMMARQHSDDYRTNQQGGTMPIMTLRQMPYDYVVRISKGMKEGEISEPFQTRFGWHIIRVDDLDTLPPYQDMLPFYKQRLSRDQRSKAPKSIFAKQAKDRYGYIDYTQEKIKNRRGRPTGKYMASLNEVKQVVADSVLSGKWIFDSTLITDLRPLFKLNGKLYNAIDFCKYIESTQAYVRLQDMGKYIEEKYMNYTDSLAIRLADENLEIENKEFADLINEYRHGLMIFSYNEKMIWTKAIYDSVGFNAFYEQTKGSHHYGSEAEEPYFWNSRARISMLTVVDSTLLEPQKAMKIVNKGVRKHGSSITIQSKLKKAMGKGAKDESVVNELVLVEKDKQQLLSKEEWKQGVYIHPLEKGYQILVVEQIMEPMLKTLEEARGYYLNDYQNEVERQLLSQLRKKYNVKIYRDKIDQIAY